MSAQPSPWPEPGQTEQNSEPLFRVVGGDPTAEELAALTAVVAHLAAEQQPSTPRRDPLRTLNRRRALSLLPTPGPGAWRRSYR